MRNLVVCLSVWVGLASGLAAQVRIEAQFLPEQHVVAGTMVVRWETAPQEAWFALLANLGRDRNPYLSPLVQDGTYVWGFDPSWTKIERVAWGTAAGERELPFELLPAPPTIQTYSLSDVLLKVPLPGGRGELRIVFRTRFPHVWMGESGRLGDIYTWRFGWHPLPFSPPADRSWPLVLQAHDYELVLQLPKGWEAALPGKPQRKPDGEGILIRTQFARPVRSVSLYIGPKEKLRRGELLLQDWIVEIVALPGHEEKLRALATYIPEILAYYGERYGPCGYERILLVEHPNELGVAMTADGAVYFPRWFFDRLDLSAEGILTRLGRYILAHELAHFWWGIGIGVDFDAENWLSEGMCQYMSIRWYEETFGAEGGNVFQFERKGLGEEMAAYLLGFLNLREHLTELPYLMNAFDGFDEAVVKPLAEVRYAHATGDRLYNKGYLVLRAMAYVAGESVFDRVLAKAHARGSGGVISVENLKGLLEEETGRDWSPFFSQWVYGDAWADYAIVGMTRTREGAEHVTRVRLERKGTGAMPVTVEVRGPEGERLAQTWDGEEATATLEFRTQFPVVRAGVDPEHRALDLDRLNNWWPRKFLFSTGKNELPLDAYLVQTDIAGEGLTLSYLDRFGWGVYPNQRAALGWVRYGRDWTLSGQVALGHTLLGEVSLTRHLWWTPKTGLTGTYWEPVGSLTLTLARIPEWAMGVNLEWRGTIARVHQGGLSILALPGAGWRGFLAHAELLGLAPQTYLVVSGGVGVASSGLPERFLFSLEELWIPREHRPPRGDRKLLASAGLWLPPFRLNYALGGAGILTEVRPHLHGSLGRLWRAETTRTDVPTYAEVGTAFVGQVEALGGFLGLTVAAGAVWPLSPPGEMILYIAILAGR